MLSLVVACKKPEELPSNKNCKVLLSGFVLFLSSRYVKNTDVGMISIFFQLVHNFTCVLLQFRVTHGQDVLDELKGILETAEGTTLEAFAVKPCQSSIFVI